MIVEACITFRTITLERHCAPGAEICFYRMFPNGAQPFLINNRAIDALYSIFSRSSNVIAAVSCESILLLLDDAAEPIAVVIARIFEQLRIAIEAGTVFGQPIRRLNVRIDSPADLRANA